VTTYLFPQSTEYQLVAGTALDLASLMKFLQVTYQELYPDQQNYQHLQATVDRYFSAETPLWFINTADATKVACLWMGLAIDQVNGIRHPNIFLVYVDPAYRRQGIGTATIEHAEAWARSQGYTQIGLQVFTTNKSAIDLYHQLGYMDRSISMMREL
jgi:GNAT superfamily N-acetyltransferase